MKKENGWQVKSLGDVAGVFNGKTPSKSEQHKQGFPILKIKDVSEDGKFIGSFDSCVDDIFYQRNKEKIILEKDVLVLNAAHNSAYVGSKTCIVKKEFADSIATGEWMIIRGQEKIVDKYFLYSFIKSSIGKNKIKNMVKGIHLYPKDVKRIKIPFPPLPIQKQIAEILEKADEAKQKRKEANKLTDEFLQSVFIEMFGDPVKNPKGWEVKRFDEITEIIMGQSPMGDTYNEVGNGSPLLNGPAEFGIKYPVVVQWTSNPTKLSKVNDILFCVRGATAGRMNWSDKEYCIGRGLAAIRSRENSKIEVIYFFLKLKYSQFQGLGQGSTFIYLSKDLISSLKIPVPPLHLQQQFAEIVNKTEALKEKQKQSEQELEKLFQSLMQRAFKGELVS